MKKKKLKKTPKFKNKDLEQEFWDARSSMGYVDWLEAKKGAFFDIKPNASTIAIRMTNIALAKLKQKANRMDVPYQALIKQYVEMGLRREDF